MFRTFDIGYEALLTDILIISFSFRKFSSSLHITENDSIYTGTNEGGSSDYSYNLLCKTMPKISVDEIKMRVQTSQVIALKQHFIFCKSSIKA
jgi:hypothetical protein